MKCITGTNAVWNSTKLLVSTNLPVSCMFMHRSENSSFVQLQETLQQMLQQMDICQKALSNFLEDKRSAFPRFYFIGDDDLLEVTKAPACFSVLAHLLPNMCLPTRVIPLVAICASLSSWH